MWIITETYEKAKERLGLIAAVLGVIAAVLGVIAACFYLVPALKVGSTECNTPHSCSKTTIGKCRDCKILPPRPSVREDVGHEKRCKPRKARAREVAAPGAGALSTSAAYY